MSTILYFSTNCGNCKEFLTKLQKNPEVSNKIVKAQLGVNLFPPYIQSVPTIQIPDPQSQGKAVIYEGQDAFDWLDSQTAQTGTGLMDYDPMAMGGVFGGGASFAGLDDKEAIPNMSMADYNDPNAGRIGAPEQGASDNNGGQGDDELSRRMEMMQMQREKEMQQAVGGGQGLPPPM